MVTRRTTRRRPDAKPLRRVAGPTSNPSHPRVGLHPSQTRRTRGVRTGYKADPTQNDGALIINRRRA